MIRLTHIHMHTNQLCLVIVVWMLKISDTETVIHIAISKIKRQETKYLVFLKKKYVTLFLYNYLTEQSTFLQNLKIWTWLSKLIQL